MISDKNKFKCPETPTEKHEDMLQQCYNELSAILNHIVSVFQCMFLVNKYCSVVEILLY